MRGLADSSFHWVQSFRPLRIVAPRCRNVMERSHPRNMLQPCPAKGIHIDFFLHRPRSSTPGLTLEETPAGKPRAELLRAPQHFLLLLHPNLLAAPDDVLFAIKRSLAGIVLFLPVL